MPAVLQGVAKRIAAYICDLVLFSSMLLCCRGEVQVWASWRTMGGN